MSQVRPAQCRPDLFYSYKPGLLSPEKLEQETISRMDMRKKEKPVVQKIIFPDHAFHFLRLLAWLRRVTIAVPAPKCAR